MKIPQKQRVIDYINKFGSISSWEAYADLGITQLGARIDQLKKEGYNFKTEWESSKNRFGDKTEYKRYYLIQGGSYDKRNNSKKWRSGLSKFAVAKDYMQEYNREAKKRKETKITKDQALAYVAPIIFDYETKDWK